MVLLNYSKVLIRLWKKICYNLLSKAAPQKNLRKIIRDCLSYRTPRGRWRIGENSCHHHRHATPTYLICHCESPHPTHRHRSPVQQAPNSHGVRTLLLEGRLHRHLQQGICRSPSKWSQASGLLWLLLGVYVHGLRTFVLMFHDVSLFYCAYFLSISKERKTKMRGELTFLMSISHVDRW